METNKTINEMKRQISNFRIQNALQLTNKDFACPGKLKFSSEISLNHFHLINHTFYVEYFYEKFTVKSKVVFMQIGGIRINANKLLSIDSILNSGSLVIRVYAINAITEKLQKKQFRKSS
jgi:hypothetical protein